MDLPIWGINYHARCSHNRVVVGGARPLISSQEDVRVKAEAALSRFFEPVICFDLSQRRSQGFARVESDLCTCVGGFDTAAVDTFVGGSGVLLLSVFGMGGGSRLSNPVRFLNQAV